MNTTQSELKARVQEGERLLALLPSHDLAPFCTRLRAKVSRMVEADRAKLDVR